MNTEKYYILRCPANWGLYWDSETGLISECDLRMLILHR